MLSNFINLIKTIIEMNESLSSFIAVTDEPEANNMTTRPAL